MTLALKQNDPDPIYVLRSGPHSVSTIRFARFGKKKEEYLISGSQNGLVQVWNLRSRRVIVKLEACQGEGILYADIINLNEEDVIISHGRNGVVQLWTLSDGEWKVKKTLLVYEFGYCPIALHEQDGVFWLAFSSAGDSQFSVTKLDFESAEVPFAMKPDGKRGIVMHIRLFTCRDKICALVGYEDGTVTLWDIQNTSVLCSKKLHNDPVMCLDSDRSCSKFISGSADHTLHVVPIDEWLRVIGLSRISISVHGNENGYADHAVFYYMNFSFEDGMSHDSTTSGFACASIRHDGKIVVCGGWDGKIRVFGWKKLKPLAILKYHAKIVNNICFNSSNQIAAASKDGRISVWDVYKDV